MHDVHIEGGDCGVIDVYDLGTSNYEDRLCDCTDLASINELMLAKFTGKPELDLGSAKQMKTLLYDIMKMPIRHINDTTITERVKQPELDAAVRKFKKVRAGTSSMVMGFEGRQAHHA